MGSKFSRFLKKVAKPVAVIAAIAYPPLIPAIGAALGATGAAATVVGAAALSTGASLASGDSIEDALKSGVISGASAGIGQLASGVTSGVAETLGGGSAANIAANALTGGTTSELLGGDFAEGALISGVGSGINQARLAAAGDYLSSFPSGYGEYSDAPPDMSDFGLPPSSTPSPPSFNDQSVSPLNIDGTLAALNLGKTVAPYAITALLSKNAYDLATKDDQGNYNYPIVPIPSDWKSPEYNQTFTPSAPIDFGNPEMLAGTQFANPPLAQQPMNLSSLINTLNLQQPQQQFGMNEIVGSINDVPMSINDIISNLGQNTMQPFDMNQSIGQLDNAPASLNSIISGIQSQYG
jgi:hypothetical protein